MWKYKNISEMTPEIYKKILELIEKADELGLVIDGTNVTIGYKNRLAALTNIGSNHFNSRLEFEIKTIY